MIVEDGTLILLPVGFCDTITLRGKLIRIQYRMCAYLEGELGYEMIVLSGLKFRVEVHGFSFQFDVIV